MKKIIFGFLCFLISSFSNAQSGWMLQNSNLNKKLNDVFFINSQTGWIVADSSKILRTTNSGVTWANQTLPFYSPLYSVYFINENTGWAAGGYWYFAHAGIVYKTTNGGTNWFINSHTSEVTDIHFINENTGFISYDNSGNFVSAGGISKTTNGGVNWENTENYYEDYVINSIDFNNSIGWACGYYSDDTSNDSTIILKTTNYGSTWTKKYLENNYTWSDHPKQIFSIKENVWAVGKDSALLRSIDSGENWHETAIQTSRRFNTIYFTNVNTGWIAGSRYSDTTNILKSTNGGLNWFNLRNIYPDEINSITFVNENTGWAVGGFYYNGFGMILKTTTGGLTFISSNENQIIENFHLEQSYPNPFNPTTKIKFDLAKKSFIKLSIYDIQGKLVKTIVEGELTPGSYEREFDGKGVSSGIYFYKMEADNFTSTKRMMLVR